MKNPAEPQKASIEVCKGNKTVIKNKVLKCLELIIKTTRATEREKIQNKLQNKLKYKNNSKCFFGSQLSVSSPPREAQHASPHLASRPSNTRAGLGSRPPLGTAQTNLPRFCVFLPPVSTAARYRVFSFY